ncbi:tetratricopeptide repeat protein [Streptomyces sp. CNZ748]|uniref:tetratricopeptide repeat protein n=1 Tax=Streptomyces sp. CNZ748 TaxID=2885160 RepID=UPI0027DECFD6|nr:tetratricopeptide repeat protein [Streptomyces sp. CNZ748]
MARARVSLQELVRLRTRAGLVARSAERELFRANFTTAPEDGRHRFLFHVHGTAGVGKTRLVKEFEHLAREQGALTAYVDESAGGVAEVLEAMCRQFAAQGHRLKDLERLLTSHRERRHEAETAALTALEPVPDGGPSAGGMALARAGLAGLGLVPGVAPFAAVLDPEQLAHGADRLRSTLAARFRSHEDVTLVLDPASVLTPVLTDELSAAASDVPWIVLFLDTYERTGPFLDAWLHDLLTTDRHGALPATVVVVTAGQRPADPARWGTFADFMTSLPLQPFTEAEARGLLAERGVTAEPVVAEALRLTGGLPVLLSTVAGTRPAGPEDVTDPSATAVERFLKWEPDPARRAAALAGALPRLLDADVFAVAADCDPQRADLLYGWVATLPFADRLGGRIRYHDVVRAPMLRLQRGRSPRGWFAGHRRLADAFRRWREAAEGGRDAGTLLLDDDWCELRLAELYHRLCASGHAAVSDALRDLVEACDQGEALAGRWIRVLEDAGRDAEVPGVIAWGGRLADALRSGGTQAVLEALLAGTGHAPLAAPSGALPRGGDLGPAATPGGAVHGGGGWGGSPEQGGGVYGGGGWGGSPDVGGDPVTADLDPEDDGALDWMMEEQAREITPSDVTLPLALVARIHRDRALAHAARAEHAAAVTALSWALTLTPDDAGTLALRGEYLRVLGRHQEAAADLERAAALDPADAYAHASLGATRLALGRPQEAGTALDRALALRPDYPWALVRRARVARELGDTEGRLAALDRAVAVEPDSAWAHCERGDALRAADRDREAVDAYDRALALDPGYASAYASRGVAHHRLGRLDQALADLDRALELNPSYAWARERRDEVVQGRDG